MLVEKQKGFQLNQDSNILSVRWFILIVFFYLVLFTVTKSMSAKMNLFSVSLGKSEQEVRWRVLCGLWPQVSAQPVLAAGD